MSSTGTVEHPESTPQRLARDAEAAGDRVEVPLADGLRFGQLVRAVAECANEDRMSSYARSIAFQVLFACFPCLFTLFWLSEAFGGRGAVNGAVELFTNALPKAAGTAVKQQFSGATGPQSEGALTLGAFVAVGASLWALTLAFRATMEAMNALHGRKERRPLWKRYLVAFLLSLAVSMLLVGSLFLLVFGSAIARHIGGATGFGPALRWASELATWPALVAAVTAAFALLYYFAPDGNEGFRWVARGTILAAAIWLLFTAGFSLYVNVFASPTQTYGALAGIAVLMLYVYGACFVMLIGAEINKVIEQHAGALRSAGRRYPQGDSNP